MEMHQLRYVVAIARAGNFSRASEQCHVSQPSLSEQIRKLEDELGERLFDRLRKESRLTAYGKIFLERAQRILGEVEAAQREAAEAKAVLRGTLTVGVLPTIAPYLLPAVLAKFGAENPQVHVVVQEETTAVLIRQALAHEIDFALASLPIEDERIAIRKLFGEDLVLALPRRHRLVKNAELRIADLEGENFIIMKEGHCLGDQVMQFCTHRKSGVKVSFRSSQLETIRALVSAGRGLSLVPAMAARRGGDEPVYRSLADAAPKRQIVAFWPSAREPGRAAEQFINAILKRDES